MQGMMHHASTSKMPFLMEWSAGAGKRWGVNAGD
jgi:hypothetical protein